MKFLLRHCYYPNTFTFFMVSRGYNAIHRRLSKKEIHHLTSGDCLCIYIWDTGRLSYPRKLKRYIKRVPTAYCALCSMFVLPLISATFLVEIWCKARALSSFRFVSLKYQIYRKSLKSELHDIELNDSDSSVSWNFCVVFYLHYYLMW